MKCALLVLGCDGLNPNTTNYYPVTMGSQLYHMPHPEAPRSFWLDRAKDCPYEAEILVPACR